MEILSITAYLNGAKWNPAGVNGQASGPLSDVFVMLVWRVDQNGRTNFPFNWGMGDHFPWEMVGCTGVIREITELKFIWPTMGKPCSLHWNIL